MWYYKQEEDNFKESAKTVLLMLLFIMFCSFPRVKMAGIQESLFVVLNLEKEVKMQDKEKERKGLTHSVCLIYAIMPIIYMSGKVLNHLFSIVESCSSNLLLMHRQTVNRENSTGLGHISIPELYQGLQNTTIHDRHDSEDIGPLGCKLIFPSSHIGSPSIEGASGDAIL